MEIAAAEGSCTGITFRKCLSVKNAEGRFAPVYDDAVTETREYADSKMPGMGTVFCCIYCFSPIRLRTDWAEILWNRGSVPPTRLCLIRSPVNVPLSFCIASGFCRTHSAKSAPEWDIFLFCHGSCGIVEAEKFHPGSSVRMESGAPA